jgi:tripartite-type tricarboxylate transporter receptor subunit TctC
VISLEDRLQAAQGVEVSRIRYAIGLIGLLFAVLTVTAAVADAQPYPNRPLRLVVGFTAGGSTDLVARLIAEKAKSILGQNVIVENRPGANAAIAAQNVARSEPDGYSLFYSTVGALAINPGIRTDLPYDPIKDFTPVGTIARNAVLIAVNPSLQLRSGTEFIARAKERPRTISIAITGVGAISHLSIELLQAATGISLLHVPYRGSAHALNDFLSGQLNAMSAEIPVLLPQIRAGKMHIVGSTLKTRSEVLPDVPTFTEMGFPEVLAENWAGILVPAGTPREIVNRLNEAFRAAVNDPEVLRKLAENGVSPFTGTPEEFAALIASETARWGAFTKNRNIKGE